MENFGIFLVMVMLVAVSCGAFVMLSHKAYPELVVANNAIFECEKSLPRDQKCEVVITAQVAPTKED